MKHLAIGVAVMMSILSTDKTLHQPPVVITPEPVKEPVNEPDRRKQNLARYIMEFDEANTDALEVAAVIVDVADEYGLDSLLVAAIICSESSFKISSKNDSSNCIGLMQVRTRVWTKDLIREKIIKSEKDLEAAHNNVRAGCYILSKCINSTDNIYQALLLYNGEISDRCLPYLAKVANNYTQIANRPLRWTVYRKDLHGIKN